MAHFFDDDSNNRSARQEAENLRGFSPVAKGSDGQDIGVVDAERSPEEQEKRRRRRLKRLKAQRQREFEARWAA